MRLEWLPWIRQRNWQAFDDLARSEPSWLLFETVRELALGYPNDDDRDRLRLVLRTLSEQGYADEQSKSVESPAPVAQRPESYYLPCSPYQLASMTCSDATGRAAYNLFYKKNGESFNILAVGRHGEFPDFRQHKRWKTVMLPFNRAKGFKTEPPPGYFWHVEAPFALVAAKVARNYADEALRQEHGVPPWVYRDLCKYAKNLPHPAATWQSEVAGEELQTGGWKGIKEMTTWILPVNWETTCMQRIGKETIDGDLFSPENTEKRMAIYHEHWDEALSPELLDLTTERLNDLAFVLARICRWDDALAVASLARAVVEQGRDAPFFESILQQTALDLPKHAALDEEVAARQAEIEAARAA